MTAFAAVDPHGPAFYAAAYVAEPDAASGTLAEGIESVDQSSQLKALGCTYGQGYLFARPAAPDDVAALLCRAPVVDAAA